MEINQTLRLRKHEDWPTEIQITDFDCYAENAPFTSTYTIVPVVYTDPLNDSADLGHTVLQ